MVCCCRSTVASGAISQDDLNSQQNYCFSADSSSPFFLGGDRSIQLSYGGLYRKYSILQGSRIRTIRFLGGERSILLSYRDIYSIFDLFPGFLELQPVLRRLRRAVLLIKKRSIFDRFISNFRIIDPSAIVRR